MEANLLHQALVVSLDGEPVQAVLSPHATLAPCLLERHLNDTRTYFRSAVDQQVQVVRDVAGRSCLLPKLSRPSSYFINCFAGRTKVTSEYVSKVNKCKPWQSWGIVVAAMCEDHGAKAFKASA